MMNRTARGGQFKWLKGAWLLLGMLFIGLPLAAQEANSYHIYVDFLSGTQRGEGGDTVDVIDPATLKVVQSIKGLTGTHGMGFSPDGSRIYVADEGENVLAVVDHKTGNIIKKIPLTGDPNTLAVTKDGGRVIIGLRQGPGPKDKVSRSTTGSLDVVDTKTLERVRSIPMHGGLHDIYLTPDGKYVVAGSEEAKSVTVVDVQTEQPVWEVKIDDNVNTMAFEANPDGSTNRIFVQTNVERGFQVLDFAQRKIVAKITLPDTEASKLATSQGKKEHCHGTFVSPDNKTYWINSQLENVVYAYSLPDLKLIGHVALGARPDWIAISPDSTRVYDGNADEGTLSVVDAKAMKEVARIPSSQLGGLRIFRVYTH
ncbi:MAG: hypothetical protein WCC21_04785 [Candidatus Acidiferrales bacterium]